MTAARSPAVFAAVAELLGRYATRPIDATLAPHDDMLPGPSAEHLETYLAVGRSAVQCIAEALVLAGLPAVRSVLDLACGYGRVLRHLRPLFPDARLVASDIDPGRVAFCERTFGAEGVVAPEDLAELDLGGEFDLIWCGSLLTHLAEPLFGRTLERIVTLLAEPGAAVVSLHGRYAVEHQRRGFHYLPVDRWQRIVQDFASRGFGYEDYEELADYPLHRRYGVTLTAPAWVAGQIEKLPGARLLGYHERAWDDHHDVVVVGRPAWDATSPSRSESRR